MWVEPVVSIVLPTYNGARFLEEAIESCLSQTFWPIEVVIVDDASTDETPSLLASVKDSRVRCLRNETNQGLPGSLNIGFRQSRGAYLTWTSDDNRFAPKAVEQMVGFLEAHAEVGFVYADYAVIDEDGRSINRLRLGSPAELEEKNVVGACFLFRREVYEKVGEYDPAMTLAEDYDYWLRVYRSFPMARLAEPLYYYRKHSGSLTGRRGLIRQQRVAERARTKWIGPDPYRFPSRFARSLGAMYVDRAFAAYRHRDLRATRSYGVRAVLADPRCVGNRGLMSILGESVVGERLANWVRGLRRRLHGASC